MERQSDKDIVLHADTVLKDEDIRYRVAEFLLYIESPEKEWNRYIRHIKQSVP